MPVQWLCLFIVLDLKPCRELESCINNKSNGKFVPCDTRFHSRVSMRQVGRWPAKRGAKLQNEIGILVTPDTCGHKRWMHKGTKRLSRHRDSIRFPGAKNQSPGTVHSVPCACKVLWFVCLFMKLRMVLIQVGKILRDTDRLIVLIAVPYLCSAKELVNSRMIRLTSTNGCMICPRITNRIELSPPGGSMFMS